MTVIVGIPWQAQGLSQCPVCLVARGRWPAGHPCPACRNAGCSTGAR